MNRPRRLDNPVLCKCYYCGEVYSKQGLKEHRKIHKNQKWIKARIDPAKFSELNKNIMVVNAQDN